MGLKLDTIGARASLLAGAALLAFAVLFFAGYAYTQQQTAVDGAVQRARSLVLMAESVRERVAKKWEYDVYTTDKLRRWAEQAETEEARKARILDAVPVYNAWSTAQAKAEEAGFRFEPVRENPRDADHRAGPKEMRAIQHFRNNPGADEFHFVDEQANAVRYFRPVRLGDNCLVCHGDPERSQALWGRSDGKDITGHRMEGKEAGDLHGAFQVILPLDRAEARVASTLWTGGLITVVLLLAALGAIVWTFRRSIDAPMEQAVAAMGRAVDDGDLTVRMAESGWGGAASLGRAFNRFMDHLAGMFQQWRGEADQLASASEELTATSDELQQNAQTSSQRVGEVSHSAQEVNGVVQDVAKNITEVSEAASNSTDTTKQGQQVVKQASEHIQSLSDSTRQVEEVMGTIQAIAKKTDLLALNAAIEAANAGEAGQGFAVVADEVRKLAEQTSQATEQVNGLTADLQSKSQTSVQAMEQVRTQMDQILEMIRHTDETANQIAAAAEELASTMAETTDNMGEISGNVTSVSDSVSQIETAASQLESTAQQLRSALDGFRLNH